MSPPEVLLGVKVSPRCWGGQSWRELGARLDATALGERFFAQACDLGCIGGIMSAET
jgi:hypothetical protein